MKSAKVKELKKRVDRLDCPGDDNEYIVHSVFMDAKDNVQSKRVRMTKEQFEDYRNNSPEGHIWISVNWDPPDKKSIPRLDDCSNKGDVKNDD